jgi:hypothetical protein
MSWTITGTSYPNIVTGGLVLNLDAGSKLSYPGTGTSWLDLSGNGNTGTLTNGPTYSSANGGAIVFDGSNDYVNCGISPITGNQSFSWGTWIYPTGTGTPVFFGNTSSGLAMVSYWDASDSKVRVGTWAGDRLTSGTSISSSTWGYTFWTWNGTTLISYTNGIADGTATGFSFNISSLSATIGNASNTQFFRGRIPQVSIYNRALTATEVSQNFNALRGRYGI